MFEAFYGMGRRTIRRGGEECGSGSLKSKGKNKTPGEGRFGWGHFSPRGLSATGFWGAISGAID